MKLCYPVGVLLLCLVVASCVRSETERAASAAAEASEALAPAPDSSTGLTLTLEAPRETEDFKVGIDGGEIGSQPQVLMVPAGGSSRVTVTIPLPAGGPYRVRAVARRAGAPGALGAAWATGKVTGVMVDEGDLTEASISVTPYEVEVSAPVSVSRGQIITVEWRYRDPGDVLEDGGMTGGPGGALHYSMVGFRDGRGEKVPASAVREGEGEYRMTATIVAPLADPGILYFQVVGYTFGNPVQPVPIALFDPSSRRNEPMREIGVV